MLEKDLFKREEKTSSFGNGLQVKALCSSQQTPRNTNLSKGFGAVMTVQERRDCKTIETQLRAYLRVIQTQQLSTSPPNHVFYAHNYITSNIYLIYSCNTIPPVSKYCTD